MRDLDVWEQVAGKWKESTGPGAARTQHFIKALDKLIPNPKGLNILDAGCGDGVFSKFLSDRGAKVTGVDGAESMVAIAKQKYPELNFFVADLLNPLPFADQSFDLVLANMVLMHLADVSQFLTEARRILKPGGELVFSVLHPCFNHPTMKLYKSLWAKLTFQNPSGLVHNYYQRTTERFEKNLEQKVTHYHRTLEEYSQLIQQAGMKIVALSEPHELSEEFIKQNTQFEYTTRIPRFLFFKCIT